MTGPGLRLRMFRASLADLPPAPPVPRTLALRAYRPGDEAAWAGLIAAAYPELPPDAERFARVWGEDPAALPARMLMLVTAEGDQLVGTATAWSGGAEGEPAWGRLHWVAIAPPLQGGGLARPLVAATLHRLAALGHEAAYLMTEDFRLPAIGLYMSLGFAPDPRTPEEATAWAELTPLLALHGRGG